MSHQLSQQKGGRQIFFFCMIVKKKKFFFAVNLQVVVEGKWACVEETPPTEARS